MDAKLKERAETVAQLRSHNKRFTEAQYKEIGEVHHLLTGRNISCISCNVYGLLNEINSKLIQEPLILKNMATAKIHFKPNAASTEVIRHNHKTGITTVITPENINEGDNAAFMAKEYPHLVAESKTAAEPGEEKTTTKTAAKK